MKTYTENQAVVIVNGTGIKLATYKCLSECETFHWVEWKQGDRSFTATVTDENIFSMTNYGLANAVDAEIERREENAKAAMAAGDPTATHLVRTYKTIAA